MNETELYYDPDVSLTTVDNPYDPRTDQDKWQMWDEDNGYNTTNYLARLMGLYVDATDDEITIRRDRAIAEIIDVNVLGHYYVVKPKEKLKFPLNKYY